MSQNVPVMVAEALRKAGITTTDPRAKVPISQNSRVVLNRRYLRKGPDLVPLEEPEDMFWRVASNLAEADRKYQDDDLLDADTTKKFYNLMVSQRFIPNSPTLMNAGRELQQLSACFVLPVADSIEGIFQAVKETAIIHKSGGGTGFDFSQLRPEGDFVGSTQGIASGPVSFIDAFDTATEVVKQGGTRRGANMGILRVDHPDIMDFIIRKNSGQKLQNFNISVAVTDEFMRAVRDNKDFDLIHPTTKQVLKTFPAREIFDAIAHSAWTTGDPGMVFIDTINRDNPNPHANTIASTNPCVTGDTVVATSEGPRTAAELVGKPFTALVDGQEWPANPQGFFHTGRRRIMRITTDAGHTITLTPDHRMRVRTDQGDQWNEAAHIQHGDLLVLNRTDYAKNPLIAKQHFQRIANTRGTAVVEAEITDTSHNPVATVTQRQYAGWDEVYDCQIPGINAFDGNGLYVHQCGEQPLGPNEACNLGSINLARMLAYDPETQTLVLDQELLADTVADAVHMLDNVIDMNRWPLEQIGEASRASRRIGIGVMGFADMLFMMGVPYRSQQALDIARATMRTIHELTWKASQKLAAQRGPYPLYEGSKYEQDGVPPMRHTAPVTIAPTGTISIIAATSSGIEPHFAMAYVRNIMDGTRLVEYNELFRIIAEHYGFYTDAVKEHVLQHGTANHPDVPQWGQELFQVSHEIDYRHHVEVQAAFQAFTDNAVSKTINLPNEASPDEIAEIYRKAWEMNCKGITVYRDGSKEQQVLSTQQSLDRRDGPAEPAKRPRPKTLDGATTRVNTGHGALYVTITIDPDSDETRPFEVFSNMGKAGSCDAAQMEAICRLASMALRANVPSEEIVSQLEGITCHPTYDGGVLIKSTPDAIAHALHSFTDPDGAMRRRGHNIAVPETEGVQLALQNGAVALPYRPSCPMCSAATYMAEGCETCQSCSWSRCE